MKAPSRAAVMGATLICAVLAAAAWLDLRRGGAGAAADVVLLVPDDLPLSSPYVSIWRDAAAEDGLRLEPMHVSPWVRDLTRNDRRSEGVILPDTFHRRLAGGLGVALTRYVGEGGRLMAVHDAGVLNEHGRYPARGATLSHLVGLEYGLYHELRESMSVAGAVVGGAKAFERVGLPPGRYVSRAIAPHSDKPVFDLDRDDSKVEVVGYAEGLQRFPALVTRGEPNNGVLLRNDLGGVVASRHKTGRGETLFVNLPLTYFKRQADGVFMHGFLRYFAVDMLGQPRLSEAPRARGVVVLNWHVDAMPAIPAMERLAETGLFDTEGPFSFHLTAGPDLLHEDDDGGLDLDENLKAQAIFRALHARGHAVASHGGWTHNHFGYLANEENGEEMLPLLDLNHDSIVRLTGESPREYSAPMGNHPSWTTEWLVKHGVVATYLTGNIGMGPTRLWAADKRASDIWTFPVLTMGTVATAEDAHDQRIGEGVFENWLLQVARFVEEHRAIRLVYFHPPGAMLYPNAVRAFVERVGACRRTDRCRWMTMTQAADFLTRREGATWSLRAAGGSWTLEATHPQDLADLAWRLPKSRFREPRARTGAATVEETPDEWLVIAGAGRQLTLQLEESK